MITVSPANHFMNMSGNTIMASQKSTTSIYFLLVNDSG